MSKPRDIGAEYVPAIMPSLKERMEQYEIIQRMKVEIARRMAVSASMMPGDTVRVPRHLAPKGIQMNPNKASAKNERPKPTPTVRVMAALEAFREQKRHGRVTVHFREGKIVHWEEARTVKP